MIKKRQLSNKTILKKIAKLEAEFVENDTPFIAFIGKLPDGRYEVAEQIGVGQGRGNTPFKSVKHVKKIVANANEYFAINPTWTVIYGEDELEDDLPISEVCKAILNDDYSKIKIKNEGVFDFGHEKFN